LFSKGAVKNYSGCHTLRGIQICSNLIIRGIYTSSNVYDWNSLPKELAFKIGKGGRWEDNYNFIYLPAVIDPAEVRRKLKEQEVEPPKEFPNSIVERE
jgi:WD repeat-containing protein 90